MAKRKLPKSKKTEKTKENLPQTAQRELPFTVGTSETVEDLFKQVADQTADDIVFISLHGEVEEFLVGKEKERAKILEGLRIIGEDLELGRWIITADGRKFDAWPKEKPLPPRPESEKTWYEHRGKISLKFPDERVGVLNLPPYATRKYSKWRNMQVNAGLDIFAGLYNFHARIDTFKNGNKAPLVLIELLGVADVNIVDAEVVDENQKPWKD